VLSLCRETSRSYLQFRGRPFPRSRPHLFGVDVVVSTTSASNYTVTWTPKPGDPM
jgi:hypothetical protein